MTTNPIQPEGDESMTRIGQPGPQVYNTYSGHTPTSPDPDLDPVSNPVPAPLLAPPEGTCRPDELILDLDHLDRALVQAHRDRLPRAEQQLLDVIDDRINAYPRRFDTPYHREDNYRDKATIIALSGWAHREAFCHCCWSMDGSRSRTCGKPKFCTYCNYLRRKRALLTYLRAFLDNSWAFTTLSYGGNLLYEPEASDVALHWDACSGALKGLVAEEVGIHGAYWSEEISIQSLFPEVLVLPHCHAVLHADSFDEEMVRELEARMAGFRDEGGFGPDLDPSVRWNPIGRESDFVRQVGYVTKTIGLVEPYRAGLEAALRVPGAPIWRLNENVSQFFAGFMSDTMGRRQISRLGTLDARTKAFIGTKKDDRPRVRPRLRDALTQIRDEGLAFLPATQRQEPEPR